MEKEVSLSILLRGSELTRVLFRYLKLNNVSGAMILVFAMLLK